MRILVSIYTYTGINLRARLHTRKHLGIVHRVGISKYLGKTMHILHIKFEGEYDDEWSVEPVIVFEDETSYSIEKYFNEEDFKKLIKAIERLGEDYEDLLENVAGEDY